MPPRNEKRLVLPGSSGEKTRRPFLYPGCAGVHRLRPPLGPSLGPAYRKVARLDLNGS